MAAVGGALAALVICGFFIFPGHTYLYADTQIYLPILERLRDPSLYPSDPVALRPHVAYTIYDEVALGARALTGVGFQAILEAQQILYRFCGLVGVFLIGRAFSLSIPLAVVLASIYGLTAWVGGPSVLVLEYEPVPRGFAAPLLTLGIGLAVNQRWVWAGCAAGLAILYHPPTTVPFLVVFGLVIVGTRQWKALLPIGAAVALSYVLSKLQAGHTEPQRFWGTIDAELEKLQRMRGAYNWISIWPAQFVRHWEFLALLLVGIWYRLRNQAPQTAKVMLGGMAIYGLLMIPVSLVLLEGAKWAFMPQFQPARALLWVVLAAWLGSVLCAIKAAQDGKLFESFFWGLVAFAIPAQNDALSLLLPDWRDEVLRARFLCIAALAALLAVAARWEKRWIAVVPVMVLPFWLIPGPGKVVSYREIDHPEVHQLADWARANTAKEAVFVFPDAGQELYPGLFRVYALRGLYVDWKGGGQVNLLRDFAVEWWQRWQAVGQGKFDPGKWESLSKLPVDYVVLQAKNRVAGEVAYENGKYVVYKMKQE